MKKIILAAIVSVVFMSGCCGILDKIDSHAIEVNEKNIKELTKELNEYYKVDAKFIDYAAKHKDRIHPVLKAREIRNKEIIGLAEKMTEAAKKETKKGE